MLLYNIGICQPYNYFESLANVKKLEKRLVNYAKQLQSWHQDKTEVKPNYPLFLRMVIETMNFTMVDTLSQRLPHHLQKTKLSKISNNKEKRISNLI